MNLRELKLRFDSVYVAGVVLLALGVVAALLSVDNRRRLPDPEKLKFRCNLFSGRWVLDNHSYPLYEEEECSLKLEHHYACHKYGRKDSKYQKWRWQPHNCDLPRFNGTAFLEKIRGKKVVFVGDSMNNNQWTSLLCLIQSSLTPSTSKLVTGEGNLSYFQAIEYNATIGFYWSPFLVESNCDDPVSNNRSERIVRVKSIEKHAGQWSNADILVFNSFLWWLHPSITILSGSFGSPDAMYNKTSNTLGSYEIALETWSNWLEVNINRSRTKLFFTSISPYHKFGESWGDRHDCYNETEPIEKQGYWGIETDRNYMMVVESMIKRMEMRGLKIQYLNITNLSDYRRDAHPSIYGKFLHKNQTADADPISYSDCFHWCLPGVPDVWNQLLYSYIVHS